MSPGDYPPSRVMTIQDIMIQPRRRAMTVLGYLCSLVLQARLINTKYCLNQLESPKQNSVFPGYDFPWFLIYIVPLWIKLLSSISGGNTRTSLPTVSEDLTFTPKFSPPPSGSLNYRLMPVSFFRAAPLLYMNLINPPSIRSC